MNVWVFGNPDIDSDALPLRLLPELKKRLPAFQFIVKDPHDEWELPPTLVILDTVQGIDRVTSFSSIESFVSSPRLTLHDFDLGTKLRWLQKLKKLPPFILIGIPMHATETTVLDDVVRALTTITPTAPSENGQHSSCTGHTPE